MTYILGWKCGPTVYLAADSAVTSEQLADRTHLTRPSKDVTSFGERNVRESHKSVYEGTLKLINLGRAAIAMCGDVALCRAVVGTFKSTLSQVGDPRKALEFAVAGNGPFNDLDRQVQLIVAFPESPTPALLAFNIEGDQDIHEINEEYLVQFGSINHAYKSVSPQMINRLRVFTSEPHRFLACGLAFLQSYGIRRYLLECGVGGVFCGLLVGEHSIEWQKDILFCLHNGAEPEVGLVSSIVRDHVLVVRSTLSDSCKYFGDSLTGGLNDGWKAKWWDSAFDFPSRGRFEFVVLLNTRFHIITVIEMLHHLTSAHLRISPTLSEELDESICLNLAFSPTLTEAMMEPVQDRHDSSMAVKFSWFPYEPAD